jgi:hypothetical protein
MGGVQGTVDIRIGLVPLPSVARGVWARCDNGKPATSHFRVLEQRRDSCVVQVRPHSLQLNDEAAECSNLNSSAHVRAMAMPQNPLSTHGDSTRRGYRWRLSQGGRTRSESTWPAWAIP